MVGPLQFDEIGIWSEIKLQIIREYAKAYSTILSAQTKVRFSHVYIDAFAGAGQHISRATHELVPGSPLNALAVEPRFDEFYLIDIKPEKIDNLRGLIVTVETCTFSRATVTRSCCAMSFRMSSMRTIAEACAYT